MKRLFVFVVAVALSFSIMGTGNATLKDNGGNLIYDTDLNITWYAVGTTPYVDWAEANSWATGLTLGGVSGWRLPTTPGTASGFTDQGEMGNLYYDELGNPACPNSNGPR